MANYDMSKYSEPIYDFEKEKMPKISQKKSVKKISSVKKTPIKKNENLLNKRVDQLEEEIIEVDQKLDIKTTENENYIGDVEYEVSNVEGKTRENEEYIEGVEEDLKILQRMMKNPGNTLNKNFRR